MMIENYRNIPSELIDGLWCCWLKQERETGKIAKVPYNARNKQKADTSDIGTFAPYQEALAAVAGYDGLGILISGEVCAIDIDHCIDDYGNQSDMAQFIIKEIDSYTEISPSGKGIRIFFQVPLDFEYNKEKYYINNSNIGLEIYIAGVTNKYVTVTGNMLGNKTFKAISTAQLLEVMDRYMLRNQLEDDKSAYIQSQKPNENLSNTFGKDYLKTGLEKDMKLIQLYQSDSNLAEDPSESDFALCCKLAYWCNNEVHKIKEAFLNSPYGRSRLKYNFKKIMRDDYLINTIQKAISSGSATANGNDMMFLEKSKVNEVKEVVASGKTSLNFAIFQEFLLEQGIKIQDNLITGKIEISGIPIQFSRAKALNTLPTYIVDFFKAKKISCNKALIEDFIEYAADLQRYNPVEKMLTSGTWDGESRFPSIYEILGVHEELSKILIRKWFHQTVAMALNDETQHWGADGVLVLQGQQGVGKTRFFSIISLESAWFVEGASINVDNKDSIIKATGRWITELGELDSTLKREQEALKAFITATSDTIRSPYQRADVTRPRRTSFCATVNPDQYLRDETGSRRFWTVPVKHIDLKRLEGISKDWIIQLWLESYQQFLKGPQGFRLTKEENQKLLSTNSAHNKPLMFEEEIRDLLNLEEEDSSNWIWCTATEITDRLRTRVSAENFGKVFRKLQAEHPALQVLKKRSGKLYFLAIRKDY